MTFQRQRAAPGPVSFVHGRLGQGTFLLPLLRWHPSLAVRREVAPHPSPPTQSSGVPGHGALLPQRRIEARYETRRAGDIVIIGDFSACNTTGENPLRTLAVARHGAAEGLPRPVSRSNRAPGENRVSGVVPQTFTPTTWSEAVSSARKREEGVSRSSTTSKPDRFSRWVAVVRSYIQR